MSADAPQQLTALSPAALRRTLLAVGAGWAVPGLGHFLVGHARRGILFGAIIWASFTLGLAHDGRLALRDPRQPLLTTLQTVANLGVGPADMVARLAVYGELSYRLPRGTRNLDEHPRVVTFRERARSPLSLYGTAYLWTAGLMNLLVLFDVWDLGRNGKQ
jgi:hypothetical protein